MKRYWKIITICLVTVIVIGAFYIQSSLAAENIIIEFEKISGNENEVKNVTLNADFVVDEVHQSLLISDKETKNLTNQSLVQQFTGSNTVAAYKQLIEKYGKFMRGKDLLLNNFYEDENLVAYVSVERKGINGSSLDSFFDIDVLDKESKKSTSMRLDIPKKENYGWVDVVDIQIVDGNLKVIARGYRRTSGVQDLNVYTIDVEDQKVVNDEIIYSTPAVENGMADIRILNDYYSSQPEKYILFKAEVSYAYEHFEGKGEPTLVANDVMVYDIENNQTKKIGMDEEELGFSSDSYSIFESTLYIPSQTPNGLEVTQYDIEAEKWGEKQVVDVVFSGKEVDAPYMKQLNGKIYIISSTRDGHTLSIRDLNTEESLYEGKLKVKNQKANQKDYRLYFFDIQDAG
ncbi:hypothetical protein ACOI1C_21605 [Bacillus sp. DJP31]|uniref:hypothetical protein n=1 Tax=Bacillus sp. DJP31 TaxID=3409789 RepID=UPI003BB668CC